MDPQWLGPFKVARDLGKGFYALESIDGDNIVTKKINGKHLKIYRCEAEVSSFMGLQSYCDVSERHLCYIIIYYFTGFRSSHEY